MKIQRITKTISTFNDISVKHIVYLLDKNIKMNRYEDLTVAYEQNSSFGENGIINLYSRTREGILLESTTHKKPDGSLISSYYTYTNVNEVIELLVECEKWLVDDKFRDVFKFTQDGRPFGITEQYGDLKYTVYFKGMKTRFLIGIPFVIQDGNDSYTGIRFKNESGIIGDLTNSEFLNFKICLESLSKNLYTNSLLLGGLMGISYERNR